MKTENTASTNRKRKLLTIEPSTPVTNEAPISHGNFVEVGRLVEDDDDDVCGTSKEIWAIGSWSRTCSDENRCVITLKSRWLVFYVMMIERIESALSVTIATAILIL